MRTLLLSYITKYCGEIIQKEYEVYGITYNTRNFHKLEHE